jgi:hypothetical protein
MSDSGITVAAPPNTAEVAQILLAGLASQSGIVTDYNAGSQIRTLSEQIGSVAEITGISAIAIALQVIAYSGMSIFDITPNAAVPAVGNVTFATAFVANPPLAVQNISIPEGTLLQTLSGVQFETTSSATLLSGTSGVTVPIVGVTGGLNTNVTPGAIQQILSGLIYPLSVSNTSGTSGGLNAETPSEALNRLASKFVSLVGGSPISVANSVIGVVASGSSETVVYSDCYESWADPNSANYMGSAGFTVFIDNGSGNASAALITAATAKLNGNFSAQTPAFRPAGVPYTVQAVSPVGANVTVSGTLGPLANPSVSGSIATAVSGYFTLQFNTPAEQPQIAATVANAALGQLSSLSVQLFYSSASGTPVMVVSGAAYQRVLLNSLSISLG